MEASTASRDDPADPECAVCWGPWTDPCRPSGCRHVFCRSCLTQSLSERSHCPSCRTPSSSVVIPAVDMGCSSTPSTVRLNEIINRIRRYGQTLPVQRHFSPAPTRPVSSGIQDRISRLRETMEASVQSTPPLSLHGVTPPSGGPPGVPRALPRHTIPYSSRRWTFNPANSASALGADLQGALSPPAQMNPGGAFASLLARATLPQQDRPASPSSSSSDEDLTDDVLDVYDLLQLPREGPGSSTMTFRCPYCDESGLDELDLLDHCNANHSNDWRRVVCPICASLPHGDPNYYSRDFIGHINLRHQYYNEDFMDVRQNDAINEQAAILASYNTMVQKK